MSEQQVLGKIAPFNIPKGYMVWLDRQTFEIKGQPFAKGRKLDPAEVARRAKAKAAKKAERDARRAERRAEKEAERKEKVRRAEERLKRLKSA